MGLKGSLKSYYFWYLCKMMENKNITFEDFKINKQLRNAINELGFVYPTAIQKQSFSTIMSGENVVGIAQTGTGKTLAYLLPLIQQHKYSESRDPRVLILVPTRELVVQVVEEIESLTEFINLRALGVYGGTNINTQKKMINEGCDFLVATPGRLLDLNLTGVLTLKKVKKLVIDEVDEMLNLGFRPQLTSVLERLNSKRQNLMFSATMLPEIEIIIHDFFNHNNKIEIASSGTPLEKIQQFGYHIPNFFTKANLLKNLLTAENQDFSKVLIFIESKRLADKLFEQFDEEMKKNIGVIHSNKSQNFRFRIIDEFENGEIRFLIATDLLARGLDIEDVSHVINFDMPKTPEHYIHRIGRTGRKDKDGIAISFINEAEQEYQMEVEQLMKKTIEVLEVPEEVVISEIFTDEELSSTKQKHLVKLASIKGSKGNIHKKSEKNSKINSGSPGLKKKKHKKAIRRSGKH